MAAIRHETDEPGVFFTEQEDGTRTYLATWKVERPLHPTDPLATAKRTVVREAASFEEACRLKAEGEAAERERREKPRERLVERIAKMFMAGKWFEYWVRR